MRNFQRTLLLLTLFICMATSLHARKDHYKYEVSIAAIFQNEARWMKEWIEYHKLIGVEHFYLYNNLSTDNYKEVLEPYIKSGLVELKEWPYKSKSVPHWTEIQSNAYMHAIKKAKGVSRWMAVIDLDEYILLVNETNLGSFLKPYDSYGGLVIHWQMFGTSGVKQIPSDKLMIETLTVKAHPTYGENQFVKTILHPEDVKYMDDPHIARYKRGKGAFNTHGTHLPNSINNHFDIEHIRLNHYWTRDEDYFYTFKRPRRESWQEGFDGQVARMNRLNDVEDTTIFRFVPELRKNMGLDP